MPYANQQASRFGQSPIVHDPAIVEALRGFHVPADHVASSRVREDVRPLLHPADSLAAAGPPAVETVSVDGSPKEVVVRPDFPSATVGYVQVAATRVDLTRLLAPPEDGLVDPRRMAGAVLGQVLNHVLPCAVITCRPGQDAVESWREAVYGLFRGKRVADSEGERDLLDVLLRVWNDDPAGPSDGVEVGQCSRCGTGPAWVPAAGAPCPSCRSTLYPTDALSLHREVRAEGSNGEALGRLMLVLEVLVWLWFVRDFWRFDRAHFQRVAFVLDGPLSVFGEAADLKRHAERFLQRIHTDMVGAGLATPPLLGLQKSGPLVDHALALTSLDALPERTVMALPDGYVRQWVTPGEVVSAYGKDTDFGRRFLYRTEDGRVHVVAVPRLAGGTITDDRTSVNLDAYPTLRATTDLLDRIGTKLYENAVIPIALAHNYASLPLGLGTDVLRVHAQRSLGLPATTRPRPQTVP